MAVYDIGLRLNSFRPQLENKIASLVLPYLIEYKRRVNKKKILKKGYT